MSSRVETLLKSLSDDGTTIPKPQSRLERLLYKHLGYDTDVPEPQSRVEMLLEEALKGSSGGVATVDHTVTFLADGELYEVVSVKDGNTVNAPSGTPTSETGFFAGWQLNGQTVDFPYPPKTHETVINAVFSNLAGLLYSHFNISREEYPLLAINYINSSGYNYLLNIYFAQTYTQKDGYILITGRHLKVRVQPEKSFPYDNGENAIQWIIENVSSTPTENEDDGWVGYDTDSYAFTNFNCNITAHPHYMI